MKKFYYKKPIFALLVLLLASFSLNLQAQVFPTSATVRLVPPYNTFLSELSQGNSDKVQVILLQRDQSVPSYDVRLKFKVKLAGNVIFETAPSFVSPIINLEQNTPIVLSGADLAAYFQANHLVFANANLRNIYVNNGQVPEGLYEFCATVYSATRADRQLSNNACQIFSLSRSLPPLLNLPACGGAIPEQNPLNVRFWWTPQHSNSVNSAANTSYVLEIFEIRNADGNANNAVLSSSPVFSFPTPLTQYFYSISDPNFIVGMRYAWRVRVIDESNRDAFINNGYSAVCEFTYAPTLANGQTLVPIIAPANIQAEGKGIRAGRVWWSAFAGATPANAIDRPDRYKVEYKKVGASGNAGLEWFSEFTTTNELLINQGLEPATTYEARVQGEKGGFLGDASSIVTFTTFIPVAAVCGVTPTNTLANMTPMRNARIGMLIEVTGFEVVLDSLEAESTPGVYSGRGLIKIPFMLNQTFTVLFESLFINELGQAGEGKVWFKTKPIEEWIAENTPPISEQPISFMDFEPNTTVFPVVITGIVVLPNGQVTVVTPNGTFLADTTLIPRPVLKPTVIEDKNGNQFIVHPDGTVTSLGQAGFIPKPMTTEEKLDKIRRGLYLEALKDYKTQIETYYTANNIAIPTRGPRNHNKNIIIDLPECIGTETNEIKNNFLAIKDNINKKELRENSLKRILGTSKKTTLDFIAQKALDSLMKVPKITATEFQKFLTNTQFKTEKDSVCGAWKRLFTNNFNNKLVINFKTRAGYDGEFGFDDGHKYINQATGLKNDYLKFKVDTANYYASNLFVLRNQEVTLDVDIDPLYLKSVAKDTNFVLRFVANNTSIQIQVDNTTNFDFSNKNKNLKKSYQIQIKAVKITTDSLYTDSDSVKIVDNKNKVLGRLRVFCKNVKEKKVVFIYVAHTRNAQGVPIYPNITETAILNHLNNKSFIQGHIRWVKDTRTHLQGRDTLVPVLQRFDISDYLRINNLTLTDDDQLLGKITAGYSFATTGNEDTGIRVENYYWLNNASNSITFFYVTNFPLLDINNLATTGGGFRNCGALFDGGGVKTVAHELGHNLGLEHTFLADTDYPNRIILENATNNIMDYGNVPKTTFFLYQIQKINKK